MLNKSKCIRYISWNKRKDLFLIFKFFRSLEPDDALHYDLLENRVGIFGIYYLSAHSYI